MKVKGIPFAEVKALAFQNPEVKAAYLAEMREYELQELLSVLRRRAGINNTTSVTTNIKARGRRY